MQRTFPKIDNFRWKSRSSNCRTSFYPKFVRSSRIQTDCNNSKFWLPPSIKASQTTARTKYQSLLPSRVSRNPWTQTRPSKAAAQILLILECGSKSQWNHKIEMWVLASEVQKIKLRLLDKLNWSTTGGLLFEETWWIPKASEVGPILRLERLCLQP